jgi:hypothetical protein
MYYNLNQIQVGQALARDRKTIARWTHAGMPRNKDGSYSLPAIVNWLVEREVAAATSDQAMKGAPAAEADSPALERYRSARAAMAELDLKVKKGELISNGDVARGWALRVAEVAAGLETLADRLPPLLVGKTREEIRIVIGDEVWRLRDQYARAGKYCNGEG